MRTLVWMSTRRITAAKRKILQLIVLGSEIAQCKLFICRGKCTWVWVHPGPVWHVLEIHLAHMKTAALCFVAQAVIEIHLNASKSTSATYSYVKVGAMACWPKLVGICCLPPKGRCWHHDMHSAFVFAQARRIAGFVDACIACMYTGCTPELASHVGPSDFKNDPWSLYDDLIQSRGRCGTCICDSTLYNIYIYT